MGPRLLLGSTLHQSRVEMDRCRQLWSRRIVGPQHVITWCIWLATSIRIEGCAPGIIWRGLLRVGGDKTLVVENHHLVGEKQQNPWRLYIRVSVTPWVYGRGKVFCYFCGDFLRNV